MRRSLPWAWDLVAAVAVLLVLDVLVASGVQGPLRVVVGVPALLLAPGWLAVSALFARRLRVEEVRAGEPGAERVRRRERGAGTLERVALSVALSLGLLVLLGLALSMSPWRVRLAPILVVLTGLGVVLAALAAWGRARAAPAERYAPALPDVGSARAAWRARAPLERVLAAAVACALLLAAFSLAYSLSTQREPQRFTELHVTGPDGSLDGLPTSVAPGAEARVLLGVENHEGSPLTYSLRVVAQAGRASNGTGFVPEGAPVTLRAWEVALEPGAAWRENVTFRLQGPGVHLVAFELDKPDASEQPYRRAHLFVTVRG